MTFQLYTCTNDLVSDECKKYTFSHFLFVPLPKIPQCMIVQANRIEDFRNISARLADVQYCSSDRSVIVNGDSQTVLSAIPDQSVSLILTDPPYHSTKKENIVNDKSFKSDEDFLCWVEIYAKEWKRILRPNGSGFMFCSSAMEAKLELMLSKYFNVLSHIVWAKPNEPGYDGWKGKMKKESLRQWYPHSERIIFFEPATEGNLKRSYFGSLLREARSKCGMSTNELTEIIGAYGKVNHGGAVSNWEAGRNVPSREQYEKMCVAFDKHGIDMPCYENVIRPFEVNANVEFTDIWMFPSVKQYQGKHPAEKPIEMLEHCIRSTTFENDIVLDCFAGSGSTLIAALKTNRLSIGIEIDEKWCTTIKKRLALVEKIDVCKFEGYTFMKGSGKKRKETAEAPCLF